MKAFLFVQLGLLTIIGAQTNKQKCQMKYRSFNGLCNNVDNPFWGSAPRTRNSLIPTHYADDYVCPRASNNPSRPLPFPRELSLNLLHQKNENNDVNGLSQFHVYFGLFIAHDMSLSYSNGKHQFVGNCSRITNDCPITHLYAGRDKLKKAKCLEVKFHDGIFCQESTKKVCGCSECKPGEFQQWNLMTSFLDLSNIYGTDEHVHIYLKERIGAKLRVTKENILPLAPSDDRMYTTVPCAQAKDNRKSGSCLDIGDKGGNVSPVLQVVTTLFVREHNRLVERLKGNFNNSAVLFQVVRKILIAKMQHIVWKEYLPSILGGCMSEDLKVPTERYRYDSKLDATTTKEFVTAAFRFGHSQVPNHVSLSQTKNAVPLGQLFTTIPYLTAGPTVIDELAKSFLRDRAKEQNARYSDQLINHLREGNSKTEGDLGATDIVRGRQYGIAPYPEVRKAMKLSVPRTYKDLKELTSDEFASKLETFYGTEGLKNLDLFLVGLAEKPNCKGALFGSTFHGIIETQFRALKFGDRFWYENLGDFFSLTKEQLREIRKTSLSSIVCFNTNLKEVPKEAFIAASQYVSCEKLKKISQLDPKIWRNG